MRYQLKELKEDVIYYLNIAFDFMIRLIVVTILTAVQMLPLLAGLILACNLIKFFMNRLIECVGKL